MKKSKAKKTILLQPNRKSYLKITGNIKNLATKGSSVCSCGCSSCGPCDSRCR